MQEIYKKNKKRRVRVNKIKQILAASNAHALPRLVGNQNRAFKILI